MSTRNKMLNKKQSYLFSLSWYV